MNLDLATFSAKQTILTSMANHTSPTFHMKTIRSNNTLLSFVDELEEFSRISRASQSREYVEEFCSTKIYLADSWLHIEFLIPIKKATASSFISLMLMWNSRN